MQSWMANGLIAVLMSDILRTLIKLNKNETAIFTTVSFF